MRKVIVSLCLLVIAVCSLNAQTAYRLSYLFQYKRSVDGGYRSQDMMLDYDGKTAFFYEENRFLKDSLAVLAFDETGSIKDNDAYGKAYDIRASVGIASLHDFSSHEMVHYYTSVAYFKGTMPSVMPEWELKDERKEISGYDCRLAECSFLGRRWSVWYTESMPVPVGPWLLWGAPGAVVQASDEDKLFIFKLHYAEKAGESRIGKWNEYEDIISSRPNKVSYIYPMKEMERVHTKYERDREFFSSMHGVRLVRYEDARTGVSKEIPTTFPYIPLIPDEYWKQ